MLHLDKFRVNHSDIPAVLLLTLQPLRLAGGCSSGNDGLGQRREMQRVTRVVGVCANVCVSVDVPVEESALVDVVTVAV